MKIAVVQLSDIHFRTNKDFVYQHIEEFCRSSKNIVNECSKIVVVVSGDIAFSGKKEEYDVAYDFFKQCEETWKKEAQPLTSFEYVFVPGNHDCELADDDIRSLVIGQIQKDDNLESAQYIEQCIKVQSNFWDFYSRMTGKEISPAISWTVDVLPKIDFRLCFQCYNTAFLSTINEKQGALMVPENHFLAPKKNKGQVLTVSLFHHNTGWLTANTPHNNKKMFEKHLFETSNIVMCGHEHSNSPKIISDLTNYEELIYLENAAFQNERQSEYGILEIDTDSDVIVSLKYRFENDIYREISNDYVSIKSKPQGIALNPEWQKELEGLSIPLKHEKKDRLILPDVFIYPDLEPIMEKYDSYAQYVDCSSIPSDTSMGRVIMIDGDTQSGKTSLLRMLFFEYYAKGIYPIFICGQDIKHYDIKQIVKKQYKRQYCYKEFSHDAYLQLDRQNKVLLIDNFDRAELNNANKATLIEQCLKNYERIIITSNQQLDWSNALLTTENENDIKRYRLLPLGYEKRNNLIEKWIRLGKDNFADNDAVIIQEVRSSFDQITSLLGQQLIPAYPVFVLSLLQGLNKALTQFDISKTSYAYCYNSLIIASLIKAGTDHQKISGVLKFIEELSYNLYNSPQKNSEFTLEEYEAFYTKYKIDYNVPLGSESLLRCLCNANIIRETSDNVYEFAYKYIYYFLVAQKISDLINEDKASGIINHLCENLHKEREANILIFLVYHNGTEKQMEDLLFASWLPFEKYQPITLNTSDSLFAQLQELVNSIKATVLLKNVDPEKERENELKRADENRRSSKDLDLPTEKDFEQNTDLKDLNNSVKIIRILGQIVKNQKNTLKKEQVMKLIEESYSVGFRTISFFETMIENNKNDIVEFLLEQNKKHRTVDDSVLKSKVQQLLHMLLYRQCLAVFSCLIHATGTSDMPELYDEVANRIGTPAAKIVSFSIKTYYNTMSIHDLKNIVAEFEDNPVAMEIIKARVINYVYNNYVDYKKRQEIGNLCKLRLIDNSVNNRNELKKKLNR